MRANKRRDQGMTLIEVLVTMFLVGVGMLAVMSSMVATAKANRFSQRMDVANALIRMELERVRNMPFENIANESGDYGEYNDHPTFRHQLVVTDNGDSKDVTLVIYFENDIRSATASTIVADM